MPDTLRPPKPQSVPTSVSIPELVASYKKNGYLLIPGVLAAEEVKWLREFFLERFHNQDKYFETAYQDYFECMFEVFARYEELSWLLFKEPTVSILRALLGEDFALLRGSSVHHERYGWWWHKDTSNNERAGHRFHLEKDFDQLLICYYLQDNGPVYGGGLDVEPGTHLKRDPGFQKPAMVEIKDPFWKRLLGRGSKEKKMGLNYNDHMIKNPVSIPSKAGDLVIFNVKINHRATQKTAEEVPIDNEKLAIFGMFSRNNRHINALNDYVTNTHEFNVKDYPPSVREQAANVRMTLS
jgi:hypothetical protein